GILNRVGGEASGTSGKKAKAKSYASLKDKWEDEYAQISASKVFGDAKARLDKARQKYFDDKEWSEMPFSQRMGRRMGNLGSGLGRLGNMGVNFLGALGHTEGKDPALGNASQSLSKSLMGIGGKLGAFGNALGVITSSLQSMKAFADSAHRMN